jgi:hypothetical protein
MVNANYDYLLPGLEEHNKWEKNSLFVRGLQGEAFSVNNHSEIRCSDHRLKVLKNSVKEYGKEIGGEELHVIRIFSV